MYLGVGETQDFRKVDGQVCVMDEGCHTAQGTSGTQCQQLRVGCLIAEGREERHNGVLLHLCLAAYMGESLHGEGTLWYCGDTANPLERQGVDF